MCTYDKKCNIKCSNDVHGHRRRLRERFLKVGIAGFTQHEIVELLLTLCIPRKDVKPLAKKMLQHFGSVKRLIHADKEELKMFSSGELLPFVISFFSELHDCLLQTEITNNTNTFFDTFEKLKTFWISRLGSLEYEVCELALLDANFKLLQDGIIKLNIGSSKSIQIDIHTLFHFSIKKHASAIVIAHNHPSGVCEPSLDDIKLTEKIFKGSEFLDIVLVDHLIITNQDVFSFRKTGLLDSFINPLKNYRF